MNRYFNVKQHHEPDIMFVPNPNIFFEKLIEELESSSYITEIDEEKAYKKPNWGSGNIVVNKNGWKWTATHHDTSD